MGETKNVFTTLSAVDVSDYVKEKNNLAYLPWAAAWAEVKKRYPDASCTTYPQVMDELGNTRFWHDDGRSGWVVVGVTIDGREEIEELPIMDYRNNSIPADKIMSTDANKSKKRCLVKAIAAHGLGSHLFMGEDLPEVISKRNELVESIAELAAKKASLSDEAKHKVADLCKAAEKEANPDFDDDLIRGDYKNIDDLNILEKLKKQLLAIRK